MTIRTFLTALSLFAIPVAADAQCFWGDHGGQDAAISCAEGTSWDGALGACVPTASS